MSFKVKAIYDYSSGHDDDLNFPIGQIITVTEQEDADWYGGEYVDDSGVKHEGIFPRNFVEKYEPTAPPRPTRTRNKRDTDVAGPADGSAADPPLGSPIRVMAELEDVSQPAPAPQTWSAGPPAPEAPQRVEPAQATSAASAEAWLPSSPPVSKAVPTQGKPSVPPPVSEKPSSFKDRIAAFNKASAPPIAPFKPSGLSAGASGFVKKTFVAPPPSRNAYVAPKQDVPVAKVYRRDEDPEIKEQEAEVQESAERAGLVPGSSNTGEGDEDEPKPLSLKERLALLQKQQMEQASRLADAAAKKEKPKRPKKRMDSQDAETDASGPPPLERRDTEETGGKRSMDETTHPPPRVAQPPKRRSPKDLEPRDGNEADMSGAGDTEGPDDIPEKYDSDDKPKHVATLAKQEDDALDEEEEDDDEDEDDVDPEVRRKEELRARMAKMSGGMGMAGMFGGMMPMSGVALPKKKKPSTERRGEDAEEATTSAPPVPTMMALPGMSRVKSADRQTQESEADEADEEEEESHLRTPHQEIAQPILSTRDPVGPPPMMPGARPAPPPVPSETRPTLPRPSGSTIKSQSEGSESDDELSERPTEDVDTTSPEKSQATRAPPPPPVAVPPAPAIPQSPTRRWHAGEGLPVSPREPTSPPPSGKRASRLPPPVPNAVAAPPQTQTRAPPPPPPGQPMSRSSTVASQPPVHEEDGEEEEEVTEYEGDYDTDIASSVPHRDALKSHHRDSSLDDSLRSPASDTAPFMAPLSRVVPPPIPSQPPPPSNRKSVDAPRAAPPPPPSKDAARQGDVDLDPYSYSAIPQIPAVPSTFSPPQATSPLSPSGHVLAEPYTFELPAFDTNFGSPMNPRGSSSAPANRSRASLEVVRAGGNRRSIDMSRPSMESGFVANDMDLATQPGWWLQPKGLPAQLQGRQDILVEQDESTAAKARGKSIVTRDIYVLFQDYSQTIITVTFDPQDSTDVNLEQRHQAPPRTLRQDQLEQSYERFGRAVGEAAATKKETVVGDGTPHALVHELLRPHGDALFPVGTRAYGALVYSNLANASTTQNDEIRAGDILSIRNARFQGKHGPMHQKYSAEVGRPDHVAVVAEWDGTKKKVRAWEQGRESKKVKMESFKLDDLRSGDVKIWRIMPRSWVGWEGGN